MWDIGRNNSLEDILTMSVPTTYSTIKIQQVIFLCNFSSEIQTYVEFRHVCYFKKMLNLVIMYSYSIATVILLCQYLAVSGNLYDTIVYKSNTLSF